MNREERLAAISLMPYEVIGNTSDKNTTKPFRRTAREIFAQKNMLFLFIKRDLKSKYKDSSLGFAWTLVRPLTQLLMFWLVVGKFLGAERGIPLFAIYIFTGLTAYSLFQEIVSGGTLSILANAGLVKKVYVPRELFPLASSGTAFINFVVQFLLLVVASFLVGNLEFSSQLLLLIPSTLVLVSYGLAFALLLSALNVYLRDIAYLVDVLLMLMLWASPILYSWQMARDVFVQSGTTWLLAIYTNNPITLAVIGFQEAIWGSEKHGLAVPENLPLRLTIALLIGCLFIYLSQRVFTRLQGNFAQEI